jgi:hypothetical protein
VGCRRRAPAAWRGAGFAHPRNGIADARAALKAIICAACGSGKTRTIAYGQSDNVVSCEFHHRPPAATSTLTAKDDCLCLLLAGLLTSVRDHSDPLCALFEPRLALIGQVLETLREFVKPESAAPGVEEADVVRRIEFLILHHGVIQRRDDASKPAT